MHLKAGGRRIEYAWAGPRPEAAPTLVFLHEGLGSVGQWRDFPARVAAATGWGALTYSRPGYGASDPCTLPRPITYMEDEARAVLPDVLRAAGVRGCVLVGHSDGGSIALIHAGSEAPWPGLRGLVTMAAHVFVEDVSVRSIAAAKAAWERGDLRKGLARYHGDNVECAFRGWNDAWLDPAFRAWNIEHVLPRIRVPALIVQGEGDEYGTLAQVDAILARIGGPAERLVVPGGHAPQRDAAAQSIAAIARFVAHL